MLYDWLFAITIIHVWGRRNEYLRRIKVE